MDIDNSDQRTVWCGNLSEKVTDELLFELFLQAGPIQRVNIPKDRDGRQIGYGFVTFKHEVSVQYAIQLLDGIALFDRRINLKPRTTRQEPKRETINTLSSNVVFNPLNDINTLIQMGAQMLIHNHLAGERNSASPTNYSNDRNSRGAAWERNRGNHREDRRRDDKPYRNNNRGNNGYYGNRPHGRAAHGNDHERNKRHRHH